MQHNLSLPFMTLRHTAIFAVVLSVFLSFASIAHDFDFNAEHHNSHHCQLFANAHHGVNQAAISVPVLVPKYAQPQSVTAVAPYQPTSAYLARSPPFN
ncbi:DUF2607 domain-containing protein [Vibrio vulnificus]|uniref:DUF2607 family protein n=1 Tax=Vibrio vulnificus TaxID=672 RepID=UPI0013024E4C|nr:DUF2607 family protein [Vibrio vulnificus]MCU8489493.1 DUF2607 domain-containing protein [Vibrio vulnificus]MCU8507069.1 DUF2607 domain-containing protein [Vibrio vulnificus]